MESSCEGFFCLDVDGNNSECGGAVKVLHSRNLLDDKIHSCISQHTTHAKTEKSLPFDPRTRSLDIGMAGESVYLAIDEGLISSVLVTDSFHLPGGYPWVPFEAPPTLKSRESFRWTLEPNEWHIRKERRNEKSQKADCKYLFYPSPRNFTQQPMEIFFQD